MVHVSAESQNTFLLSEGLFYFSTLKYLWEQPNRGLSGLMDLVDWYNCIYTGGFAYKGNFLEVCLPVAGSVLPHSGQSSDWLLR